MGDDTSLAEYLKELRAGVGLTLRQVERATNGVVSNVYLSQLEQGKRLEPSPRFLVALAKAYGVPSKLLFERAGYTEGPQPSEVDVAFEQVVADSRFQFGTRFHGGELDESSKRVIVELYQKATGKTLLRDEPNDQEDGS
jgi:transcriptional regulator with XRE-family HTH domain